MTSPARGKRLFIISGALNYGAPGRIVEQTGLMAETNGYEVMVAHSSRKQNPSCLPHFAVTSRPQEYIHAIGARLLDRHGLMSSGATRRLVRRIREFGPDIIQVHNIHGYYLDFRVLFRFLASCGVPVVWTLHDCWAFTGRCPHFEYERCMRWQKECHDCLAAPGYTVSPYTDRSQQLYRLKKELFNRIPDLTLVTVSDWQARLLSHSFLAGHDRLTIHNGIDLDVFRPRDASELRRKLGLEGKIVVLGVASPWSERKGLNDFKRIATELPKLFKVVMIGVTREQAKGMPQEIICVPRTENAEELATYYSMADVFVNPTYQDTYPTVNLEAIACGTPVVTYATGGSPEAAGELGRVVDQGDTDALSHEIRDCINHPPTTEQCRRYAEEQFDKEACFRAYINLYDSLLSRKS